MYQIMKGILRNTVISSTPPKKCRMTIHEVYLKPILTFKPGTWTLSDSNKSKAQAKDMTFFRNTQGRIRREKIRCEIFTEGFGIHDLLLETDEKNSHCILVWLCKKSGYKKHTKPWELKFKGKTPMEQHRTQWSAKYWNTPERKWEGTEK